MLGKRIIHLLPVLDGWEKKNVSGRGGMQLETEGKNSVSKTYSYEIKNHEKERELWK